MNDNDTISHQAVLIEKLLAAPLVAAASANSTMAQEQAKFLMDACFDTDENGAFSPKMIDLTVKNANSSAGSLTSESVTFQLPLITIIPFNSLCVKDVSVKFDLEIISHTSKPAAGQNGNEKVQMRGSVSSSSNSKTTSNQRRNQSKMAVEINGGTIPLPLGLTTLLDLYTKNIQIKS